MKFWRNHFVLKRWELAAAILMTLCLIVLHIGVLSHAGPLWRDEINSLYLATRPTVREFLASLVFDPFPIFFVVVLRIWHALGFGNSDFGLRILGFVIGTLLVGALWLCCRLIGKNTSAPLWPLALFALNPLTLHDGDAVRAYGVGMIWIVLTFGLIWQLTFGDRRPRTVVLAVIAAVLSVQSLYLNCLILFAICISSMAVLIRRKAWRAAVLIFSIGLAAALSLLPYVAVLRKAHDFLALQREDRRISDVAISCFSALGPANPLATYVWIFFSACGLAVAGMPWLRRRLVNSAPAAGDQLLFGLTALIVATVGTIAFLWISGLPTPRYLLPLMAAGSLCVHVFATTWQKHTGIRMANLFGSVLLAAALFPSSYNWTRMRMTNCDLAAATVAKYAEPNDLVIVTRFTLGISFQRYYHGAAPWKSLPDVADHTQHRWDMAREAMTNPDLIREILFRIEYALKSGQKVFLIGGLTRPDASEPRPLPPAPQTGYGWRLSAYLNNWQRQIAFLLRQHRLQGEQISLNENQPVDGREHLRVFVFSGWRETRRNSTP